MGMYSQGLPLVGKQILYGGETDVCVCGGPQSGDWESSPNSATYVGLSFHLWHPCLAVQGLMQPYLVI